jgi:tellurium resistance protein TerD
MVNGLENPGSCGEGKNLVSSLNKGVRKAEVTLRWDPSPLGEPARDLDIVAATYEAGAPYGAPSYVVHFDSRSPDGTIILTRDSKTGQGFGSDEVMTLEFDRLAGTYGRVVVGVVIQQREGRKVFGDIPNTAVRVLEGHTQLAETDFADVPGSTAAVVGEFIRGEAGVWEFHEVVRGYDTDPHSFVTVMGSSTH